MSEPSDEQAAMQHYLVCGTEDCQENGQFYCNACHRPLCEQCRDEHQKSPNTKNQEIVLYRHRKHQLPVELCQDHPTRNKELFCRECSIPLCSKCSTMKEHKGHDIDDLEEIYADKYAVWQGEFSKIQKYFLPTTNDLKSDIEENVTEIKKIMESIRTSMKAEAKTLKNLVDEVASENIENTHTMEKSILKMLKSQETTYDVYITYLWKMSDEFQEYLSISNQKLLFTKTLRIQPIPETTKPVPPVFTAGRFSKNDVTKLLGKVNVPNKKPQKRKIQLMEAESAHMKSTEKQLEQSKEKSDMKPTLSLSSSLTKVREYSVPGVDSAYHVSVDKPGRLWVSDDKGNLVQTDLQGNLLQKIQTSGGFGYHTATQDGDLIYTDSYKKEIYRITPDRKLTEFIKTGDWKPLNVHSSRINGDILVGMCKEREAEVTRYNKAGKEIQNIQRDNQGQKLYRCPCYITENINGDICTSDRSKRTVVVVNKSGQHRFSYTGQQSGLFPNGICTDVLGHILVCESFSDTVRLLDQDGGFLSVILSPQQGIEFPRGVCVDEENNLYVGQYLNNTVTVYKYLQ
uniref:Tripartite motif-containing protein 5-like isoform X1 n=1 Tax=Crassostrea virginica TaxID=6565 RepID=A0A8B8B0Y9_CRAVI|nr:tripartite motif-containing protein 5-like isoform X1 [Crassostrea virginica]XP_022297077.1 tripartite motif-containing protein 5-like isoform X1 [Crassostrea virginica]